jgi:hypothetical protein
MRNVMVVTALFCLLTSAGSAATMCANGSAVTAGFSCSVGGLTINVLSLTGVGVSPELNLVQVNTSGDAVNLAFNPNLTLTDGTQEIILVYELTGGAATVNSTVTGVNASITESACTAAFVAGACSGTSLGSFTVTGAAGTPLTLTGNDVFIMKDITVTAGGALTLFTQDFTGGGGGGGGGEVPEPVSVVLMGSGLVALSLLRKLRKA